MLKFASSTLEIGHLDILVTIYDNPTNGTKRKSHAFHLLKNQR